MYEIKVSTFAKHCGSLEAITIRWGDNNSLKPFAIEKSTIDRPHFTILGIIRKPIIVDIPFFQQYIKLYFGI